MTKQPLHLPFIAAAIETNLIKSATVLLLPEATCYWCASLLTYLTILHLRKPGKLNKNKIFPASFSHIKSFYLKKSRRRLDWIKSVDNDN